jgi:hypothetical protein
MGAITDMYLRDEEEYAYINIIKNLANEIKKLDKIIKEQKIYIKKLEDESYYNIV